VPQEEEEQMKIQAGRLEEFPLHVQKSLEIDGDYVLVLRSISGFWAIEDRCSHDDNELLGGEVLERDGLAPSIKCLRHGARFDLETGKALSLPAVKAIKSYRAWLEDDMVWVEPTGL
jgi:3-phenylpropionate/trans-cinnamate dioxygenase ferredoxin component